MAESAASPIRLYVEKLLERQRIEALLDPVVKEMGRLELVALEYMATEGIRAQTMVVDGVSINIHMKPITTLGYGEGGKDNRVGVVAALKSAGLGEFVAENFNISTLRTHFAEAWEMRQKEQPDIAASEVIPEPLRGMLVLGTVSRLGHQKQGTKSKKKTGEPNGDGDSDAELG